MTNDAIARKLRERATCLSQSGANLYRVRAYRSAALAILGLPEPVEELAATGRLVLVRGIGRRMAETIAELAGGCPESLADG